jgi:hypothetical protein
MGSWGKSLDQIFCPFPTIEFRITTEPLFI